MTKLSALVDVLDWTEELREDLRNNMRSVRQPLSIDFAKCGTPGNYRKHERLGETPCRSCRDAEYRRTSDWRKRNGEKLRANRRSWYAANRDEINRKRRAWRAGQTPERQRADFRRIVTDVNNELRARAWVSSL